VAVFLEPAFTRTPRRHQSRSGLDDLIISVASSTSKASASKPGGAHSANSSYSSCFGHFPAVSGLECLAPSHGAEQNYLDRIDGANNFVNDALP